MVLEVTLLQLVLSERRQYLLSGLIILLAVLACGETKTLLGIRSIGSVLAATGVNLLLTPGTRTGRQGCGRLAEGAPGGSHEPRRERPCSDTGPSDDSWLVYLQWKGMDAVWGYGFLRSARRSPQTQPPFHCLLA
jgi:hypothetical protein